MTMLGYCEDRCTGPEDATDMVSDQRARMTPDKDSLLRRNGMCIALDTNESESCKTVIEWVTYLCSIEEKIRNTPAIDVLILLGHVCEVYTRRNLFACPGSGGA